jgi:hypothetical protein
LDQIGSNWIKLDQIGPKQIKLVLTNVVLTNVWCLHGLDKHGLEKHGHDMVLILFLNNLPAVLDSLSILFIFRKGNGRERQQENDKKLIVELRSLKTYVDSLAS